MRLIFGLVLVIGVGLAGFAVYMAREFIGGQQAQLAAERAARAEMVQTVDVFVLNKPVRYGERITEEDLRAVKWPENAIPEGTFSLISEVFPEGEPNFRTVVRAMEKDEALMQVKVSKPGAEAGVSSRLSQGMRAFAIRVDVSSGVSGFLRPGDRVDVYWSAQNATKLILASVKLIAVDQTADGDRAAPTIARTVTVEVTPRQVAALAQAQASGRLSLALVGAQDETTTDAVEVDQGDLIGETEAPEEQSCSIRTRRGAETIEVPVPCPE
ncbi:pilus assembly protein CpaB [Aliiroseovarius halocynthiae]|uniref:Flp pilus assembly protein CpaB n=1 Tax=Aliiroseovarius halocynthiae TaxID=985055 RepID=A0A545SV40_9RHOB|nr:Flp pilus assembly protein CpaB [Aliiroseovarius halocynthiae]TQV68824.1 Flp pilus assembly protein CpaB [Aliiroseovarius halocynthiae]SMR71252.1 pilus assembly protein CpaB [Aliiroseovarius halocynthiae]